jgi:hypothetical protein
VYTLNNPANWVDHTGKYACDPVYDYSELSPGVNVNEDYNTFCIQQRERLDIQFGVSAHKINSGFTGLLQLFSDAELPGGPSSNSQGLRRQYLSAAAERLQFILWYTAGVPSLIPNFSHDRVVFNDQGFANEFQDHQLLINNDGTERAYSNQVNHFLTAVDTSYQIGWTGGLAMSCLIGHEQLDNTFKGISECLAVSWQSLQKFQKAIDADLLGDRNLRECYLRAIVPELADNTTASKPGDPREGDSIQDLRLSLKGWVFGQAIRDGSISTLEEAQVWLRRNIGGN